MPRPARSQWVTRAYARRRHRSWMLAMTLASCGWGTWWLVLFLHRFLPGLEPGLAWPSAMSTAFALAGLGVAVLTLRARRSWILFALIPLFANASLLLVPYFAQEFLGG